jgi:hypothetical protein
MYEYLSTSVLLLVNEHSAQIERDLDECRRDYEILL